MMLRRSPLNWGRARSTAVRWWRAGPSRLRLRRRLVVISLPFAVLAVLAAVKMISVVIAGGWAASDFTEHDIEGMRADISILRFADVIDPARTDFAEGDLLVLEGRLADAEAQFAETLSRFPHESSCPVRANLLLVRETLGDLAATRGDRGAARTYYDSALAVLHEAPPGCFAGSADPNEDRRAVLDGSQTRLERKLDNLDNPTSLPDSSSTPVTPQPPPDPTATVDPSATVPPPPPESEPGPQDPSLPQEQERPVEGDGEDGGDGAGSMNDVDPDRLPVSGGSPAPVHELEPGNGDPVDKLREALDNSNAYGDNRE